MGLKLLIVVFVSSISVYYSQSNPGAKQISLANSDVALSNDVFSLFNNPAGLSQITWREIGLFYSPAPFGLSELASGFIAYNEPFSFGSVAVGGMTYGFDLYKENKFLVGYSYNYLNKFFVGAALNYNTISIMNYGNDAALYLNVGGLIFITDFFRWGFSFHNINRATFSDDEGQIPVILNSGLSYNIIENASINLSIQKDIDYTASLHVGIDYNINEYISLRSGFSNEPSKYSAGLGVNYSMLSLDYAIFTHRELGLTHQAGLIIKFKTNSSDSGSNLF